jgi:hypothetical protein
MIAGMRRMAPGLGASFRPFGEGDRLELAPARIAVAAAFAALLVHTIGYAAYLTDPLTWALLAIGGVLAAAEGALDGSTRGWWCGVALGRAWAYGTVSLPGRMIGHPSTQRTCSRKVSRPVL